jgi:hypothetical protein
MVSRAELPAAAAAADPRFREFYEYWRSKAPAEGGLPGRQHIDPVEIPYLLPGIVLFDVVRDATRLRFRWRLIGTAVVDAVGRDYTGRFIDEVIITAGSYEVLHDVLLGIVQTKQPHFWRTHIRASARNFRWLQRLALPLAGDGETVDMLIAFYLPA